MVNRQFEQALPDTVRVCYKTDIRIRSGWLYSAAVVDLHSRKIVAWAMSPAMLAALVCAALQTAVVHKNPFVGLILHSERGTQYATGERYQALLRKSGFMNSISRKGNWRNNAVMKRFILNLKMERVWQKDNANHAEASNDIDFYIVDFLQRKKAALKPGQHITQRVLTCGDI